MVVDIIERPYDISNAAVNEGGVQRPDVQARLLKVPLVATDGCGRGPVLSPTESVTITILSGEVIQIAHRERIPGHPDERLATEQLWAKFRDCTASGHASDEVHALFDLFQQIDSLPSTEVCPPAPYCSAARALDSMCPCKKGDIL